MLIKEQEKHNDRNYFYEINALLGVMKAYVNITVKLHTLTLLKDVGTVYESGQIFNDYEVEKLRL